MTRTRAAWIGVGLGASALLLGCAGDGQRAAGTDERETAPESAGGDDLASLLERDVRDLESLRTREAETPAYGDDFAGGAPARRQPAVVVEGSPLTTSVDEPISIDDAGEWTAQSSPELSEPEPTSEQWVRRLGAELATRLRERAEVSGEPFEDLVRLAALELAADGVGTAGGGSAARLSGMERATLNAWREMLARASDALGGSEGDAQALIEAVRESADAMEGLGGLRILRTELCSRVEGYGRYATLGPSALVAGRRHRMIVYVEVAGFTRRQGAGDDGESGHRVQLAQELALYHAADGLLAWRQPAQQIDDFSRNVRRDFFVVQMIELPETLSVGSYRLKVTMRDVATGAEAEEILPIDVVADESATRRRSR